ncbi:glucosaminidase domain-containing protein [Listeria goaensis]|uniref:glucosaminidase domain-containing protein n=1 Tax=Listeria goaensis TaxID=1649188 RepID=UPI000B593D1D|nr:glucosaminidase domain-containing protein [Listeria goaensis]
MLHIAKKHLLKVGLISLSITVMALPMQVKANPSLATSSQQAFINEIAPHAEIVQKENGILASITISQAILESNWGKSELAQKGKNLFGIKGSYNGNSIVMGTREHNGSSYVGTSAGFKAYPTWFESLNDHATLFVNGPSWNKDLYSSLINQTDYRLAAKALDHTGYSTDPNYSKKLIEVIEKFNLDKYDVANAAYAEKTSDKIFHAVGQVKAGKTVDIWTNPAGTKDAVLIAKLSNGVSPKIEIKREAKIANNQIWYQVELSDFVSGWIESDKVEVLYSSESHSPLRYKTVFLFDHSSSETALASNQMLNPSEIAMTSEKERHYHVISMIPLLRKETFANAL